MTVPFILLQVILVPLITALVILGIGGRIGKHVGWIAFASLVYTSLLLLLVGIGLYNGGSPVTENYTWAPISGLTFGFLADGLSLPVALIMCLVCAATSVFSMPYMKHRFEVLYGHERKEQYAIYYLNYLLLSAGLLGVAFSTNLIEMYLFVELMLIPSFFLMSLYGYANRERIAMMYFVWNQLGAFIFLVGTILVYVTTGSFATTALTELNGTSIGYWVFFLIMIGWFVKMAVVGVHMWLPYAHAEHPTSFAPIMATIVGIGNYVIARLLVGYLPGIFQTFSIPFMIVALLTMIFGGAMTLVQNDIKYLFAWSTISQNAYSLLGLGSLTILGFSGGMFYFMSHIIGKCILFSVAGIVLAQTGERDMRKMGGLASKMPVTATLCLLGVMILSAVPPLSGFQAEWIMFTGIFFQGAFGASINMVIAVLGIIATGLTVAYTFWPVKKIFFGALPSSMRDIKEGPLTMTVPLLFLAAISLILGLYPDLVLKMLVAFAHALPLKGGF
ncbi:MAG: proton-conducting transporter membrane subunit [Candidatus Micrarchaeaceae archaeon]